MSKQLMRSFHSRDDDAYRLVYDLGPEHFVVFKVYPDKKKLRTFKFWLGAGLDEVSSRWNMEEVDADSLAERYGVVVRQVLDAVHAIASDAKTWSRVFDQIRSDLEMLVAEEAASRNQNGGYQS